MAKKFDFLSPGIEIREIDQSFIPAEAEADGPIIIGRFKKGPANKPVKVRNLDDFVSVFGLPVPGGAGAQGDMWRDGNMTGPTYGAYAAQAWLASENSPVTIVRLAGEDSDQATGDAGSLAGWKLSGSMSSTIGSNSTAYGLFVIASASADTMTTGSLAAVFYANKGALMLSGAAAADGSQVEEAGTFVKSTGANCEFKLSIKDESNNSQGIYSFNFSRNSANYIRSVFNTNPQLVNEDTVVAAQRKTYWLGESFAREIEDLGLSNASAGTAYGILLPLANASANWGSHNEGAAEAYSGMVISQKSTNQVDLFQFKSLHVGEDIQKDYMIAIEDIREPTNPVVNPYGTFTVAVKNMLGQTIERYVGCNLNPSDPNFLGARIGDQYLSWDETNRRYRTYGDFQNQSNIIYVDIKQFIKDGGGQGLLPAGFKGPVRPKGFTLASGSIGAQSLGDGEDTRIQATATLKIDDVRKIKTGVGAIISAGTRTAGGGLELNEVIASNLDDDTFTITFGSIDSKIVGSNGAALASKTIIFKFKAAGNISGETPATNEILISVAKNLAGDDHDSLGDLATAIIAVINGEQDNSTLLGDRTYAQTVQMHADVDELLFTNTNGGDIHSVFVASLEGSEGIKLQLRGSQGTGDETVAENHGAYGGAWASGASVVKLSCGLSNHVHTPGDQTVTAGTGTGATTVTVTDSSSTATTVTANVAPFFVNGHKTEATALDTTLTNLASATFAGVTQAADAATDTITFTHTLAGDAGNAATLAFANATAGTFTNQGTADDASELFTGGDSDVDDFTGAFVKGNDSVPNTGGNSSIFVAGPTNFTASFLFPAIALRGDGTEGGAPDPYRAYYGIRPKLTTTSTQNDPDYCDYLRRLPAGIDNFTPGSDYEHSFIFTLDDLVVNTTNNTVTYTSGAYADGTSYTALNNFGALLTQNVRQFLMPLHGGFEGWNITEKEPIRDGLISSTRNDRADYIHYTLNKALDSVKDPEVVPANLLLMPGVREPSITNRIVSIAESRKDVLAIIDLENDYLPTAERLSGDTDSGKLGSVTEAVSSVKSRNFNSSYACAFYPWVQISDNLNGNQLVWIPPSVAALGAFGRSQATSELWFAPAGFNRGGLGSLGGSRGPRVLQARQRLDSNERDKLYEVNINPIATFPAEGVVIFGQKTLQADQSALDRINVRRLLLFLKAEVSKVARNLLFDQNVQSTWNRFSGQVEPLLASTQARFGLSGYKLVLDDTTTTADLIDRNIMYAKIFVKPARAIEYIVVDFVITRTGADFV